MSIGSNEDIHISPEKTVRFSGNYMHRLATSPAKIRVRRRSQETPKTQKSESKKSFLLTKRVHRDGIKIKNALPGSLEYDVTKGKNFFLRQDSKNLGSRSGSMGSLRPAPLTVLKDKDGFFVRRSIIGTHEEYKKGLKANMSVK
jgi:hypothetical protein